MHDLNSLLTDESFQRWLSQKASREEIAKWNDWLHAAPANNLLYEQASKIWQASQFQQSELPKLDREWERLSKRLNLKQAAPAVTVRPQFHRYRRDAWARFGAVAFALTVLVVIMARSNLFKKDAVSNAPEYQTMATEYGQRATIHLPDGITVILNANSELRYPAKWGINSVREVELRGEAYFDLTPQEAKSRRDFVVRTSDGAVKVIGTQFVVYERGRGTRVVVETGKVRVTASHVESPNPKLDKEVLLQPGHLIQFQKDSPALEPVKVNIKPYTSWWEREMIFDNTPLHEIVQRLEETYGVRVRVLDPKLLERTLSGSIENQNLTIVTDALAKALRVSVKRDPESVTFGKVQ